MNKLLQKSAYKNIYMYNNLASRIKQQIRTLTGIFKF